MGVEKIDKHFYYILIKDRQENLNKQFQPLSSEVMNVMNTESAQACCFGWMVRIKMKTNL